MMDLWISFLSGIIAAFTPCVIVLMPLLLYRFFNDKSKEWVGFSLFLFGFVVAFSIFGYFLSSFFTSSIQNGLKIGIGILFITLGILALLNKLNPFNFPLIKNPFLLGIVFSLIISFNPCTLPFLSIIVSTSASAQIFINMIIFAIGLALPAILFAFFGKKILNITKRTGKIFYHVNNLMHLVLITSGIYLIFSVKTLVINDIYLISGFMIFIFIILLKAFFILNEKKDLFKLKNILLIIALTLIIFASLFHCKYQIESQDKVNKIFFGISENSNNISCGQNVTQCSICKRCIYIFTSATIFGFVGVSLFAKKKKK